MCSMSWKFVLMKQLIKSRVPVMESVESGGIIAWSFMMLNILTILKRLVTSSPRNGYRYLSKRERKSYLLHRIDTDIWVKVKKVISSLQNRYGYFRKVCHFVYLSSHKVMCQYDLLLFVWWLFCHNRIWMLFTVFVNDFSCFSCDFVFVKLAVSDSGD